MMLMKAPALRARESTSTRITHAASMYSKYRKTNPQDAPKAGRSPNIQKEHGMVDRSDIKDEEAERRLVVRSGPRHSRVARAHTPAAFLEPNKPGTFKAKTRTRQKKEAAVQISWQKGSLPERIAHLPPSFWSLWTYNSNRFLFGEIDTYSRRYRETNFGGMHEVFRKILKKAGKPSGGHIYIDKIGETKASRSIRVQMDGVLSIILRSSFDTIGGPDERVTSRSRLRVASEVAIIDLVRSYGVPAPKIVDYSCTADNPLGHAYIAFEQPTGSGISRFWMDLDDSERLKLVDELVDIEKLLWSIELPAFGSLYYSHDLPEHFHAHRVPDHGEARGLCIGPDFRTKWQVGEVNELHMGHSIPPKSTSTIVLV